MLILPSLPILRFRWTIYRPAYVGKITCDAVYDEVTIVNNSVTAGKALADKESCDGSVDLVADDLNSINTGNVWGEWTAQSGIAIENADSYKAHVVNIPVNSSDYFTWTVYKGEPDGKFCTSDPVTMKVTNYQVKPVVTKKDAPICDDNTMIQAVSVSSYGTDTHGYWSLADWPKNRIDAANIKFDSNANETTVSGLTETGDYTFHWNVYRTVNGKNICESYDDVVIKNSMIKEVDADTELAEGEDRSVCGTSTKLYGSSQDPSAHGTWT